MMKAICIKTTKYPREDYILGNIYDYYHSNNKDFFYVVNNYNLSCSFEYDEFPKFFINERKFKLLNINNEIELNNI